MILRRLPRRTYEILYKLELDVRVTMAVWGPFREHERKTKSRREFVRITILDF